MNDPHDDENERASLTDSSEVEGLDYCSSREDRSDDPDDLRGYLQEEESFNSEELRDEYRPELPEDGEENSELSYEAWKAQQ